MPRRTKACVFGTRLRAALLQQNLTQRELSRRVNFCESEISHWISGAREPRLSDLVRLASFLGVTIDFLAGFGPCAMDEEEVERRWSHD